MAAGQGTNTNSLLAAIFILTLLLLGLVPVTLTRLLSAKPAGKRQTTGKKQGAAASFLRGLATPGNAVLLVLWLFAALLLLHIRSSAVEVRPFDPFDILGVTAGSTEKEIKRAYRQLSLKFHPDKNPDPAAATYFAEFISPAYKALTDETSRANLEKHGHPDGPQGMSVGVALPAFLFDKGRAAPLVLGGIVGVGVLLPLALVVWYITRSSELGGGNVLQRTMYGFVHVTEFKSSLAASKVLGLLVCAAEYLQLPADEAEDEAYRKLFSELRSDLDAKDPKFQKLPRPARRALALLQAQVSRRGGDVPDELQTAFRNVVGMAPALLDELLKVALRPRPPHGYFWHRPFASVLEFSQSLVQAVPVGAEASASLTQLPHVEASHVLRLSKHKVRTLTDLLLLPDAGREEALSALGLGGSQLEDVQGVLGAVPCVTLRATCATEGEDAGEVLEGDLATCHVDLLLERLSADGPPDAAQLPGSKEEGWWLLLADVSSNVLFAAQKPGELAGLGTLSVDLKFRAPPAGLHLLQVIAMSDFWLGCDRVVPLRLCVGRATPGTQPPSELAVEEVDEEEPGETDSGAADNVAAPQGGDADDLTESGTSDSE